MQKQKTISEQINESLENTYKDQNLGKVYHKLIHESCDVAVRGEEAIGPQMVLKYREGWITKSI